jgi:autotransporter-associated beta strand protein
MTAGSGTTAGNTSGGVTSPANAWGRTYPLTADAAAAQTANEFVYWTTTIAEGYTVNITSFTGLTLAKTSSAGPTSAELYYSTDGTNFTKVGGTFTITSTLTSAASTFTPSSAISVTGATGGTLLTWRLVSYSGLAGRMGIGNAGTVDFSVAGTVTGGSAKDLTWGGGAGAWNSDPVNLAWKNSNNVSTAFSANDNATINGGTLTVTNIGISAGSVAVGGTTNTTISGGSVIGTTLTKSGSGILSLAASNTFSGGVTATGGTLAAGANGALGVAPLNLNGATLSVLDPAVTSVANVTSVGTNDASISVALNASPTWGGAISASGTTTGGEKGDTNSFNILNKLGAGTLVLTNAVGTQMSYDTTSKAITTAGAIQLNIASGGSVVFNGTSKTMNLGSGVITDTYDTNTPPNQLTTYNGMVWDGDFYLKQGTVQINGGNIRGTGTIYVTNTGGTFAQRLNFNSPDIDNSVNVASGSTLTLSAASGASIKFNGQLSGSGTVANTGSGGAVFGNTNPSTFTGTFNVAQTSASSSSGMTLKAQTLASAAGVTFLSGQLGLPKLKIENSSTSSGAIIACPITGPGELTKAYDGDVILTGENSFSGGLVIQDAGTIYVTNTNSLGVGPLVTGSVDSRIGLAATATTNEITITNDVNTWTPIVKTNYGTVTNGGVVTTNSTNVTTTLYMMAFAPGTNSNGTPRSIQLNSLVSNAGILKLSGGGNLYVNNQSNSYTGGTEIGTGNLIITNPAVLSTGPINFGTTTNSYLRFSSGNMTVTNRMTVSGVTTNSTNVTKYTANFEVEAGLTATLTGGVGSQGVVGSDQKYGARVEKWGAGTLVLAASNNIAESFSVNQGTVTLQTNNALSSGTAVNMSGGALLLDYSGECSTGDLYVYKGSILNLGAAGSGRSLRFSSLASEVSTSTPVILTITNTPNGSVYFPANTTTARLAQIKSAENPTYIASVNSSGLLIFNPPKQDQTITFAALASKTVGDTSFALGATASSGLPVTYTSSVPAVAMVSGSQVTIVGEGSTTITASQIGNDIYNAAPNVAQVLLVVAAPVGTTFSSWSANSSVTSDLVYKYAFGSPNKDSAAAGMSSAVTTTALSLTAVVRTDDNKLTITAKSATNLNGPWDAVTPEITIANSSDQAGLGTGLVRKIFTILRVVGENKRFLKLEASYTP